MKEDPEFGYVLDPSVNYNGKIPEGWTVLSLIECEDLYDIKELKQSVLDDVEFSELEDILITNPCIFTLEDGMMIIGYIISFVFSTDLRDAVYEDTWMEKFINGDTINFPCYNHNTLGMELVMLEDDVPEIQKVTEWPFNVMLPDTTL